MKILVKFLVCLIMFCTYSNVFAQTIFFKDYSYKLKQEETIENKFDSTKFFYTTNEDKSYWISRFQVLYNKNNESLKLAKEFNKNIEQNEGRYILLKFIQSKHHNVAIISYIENMYQDNVYYFIYRIRKYEPDKDKGTKILEYSKKYVYNKIDDIDEMAKEIKSHNDDFIEVMIVTDIPNLKDK